MAFNMNLISATTGQIQVQYAEHIFIFNKLLWLKTSMLILKLYISLFYSFTLLAAGYQYDSNLAFSLLIIMSSRFSTFLYKLQVGLISIEEINWYKNMF